MLTKEEIRDILDSHLIAEEKTFLGLPSHPIITGKDEVVDKIFNIFSEMCKRPNENE